MWSSASPVFAGAKTGFEMLALSNGYAGAASEAERAAYLASGQAMLTACVEQGSSVVLYYVLASLAGISIGFAMLGSTTCPRIAAWAAIVANALGSGLFLPGIGVLLSIVSVFILTAWYALVGWRVLRLPAPEEGPIDIGSQPSLAR